MCVDIDPYYTLVHFACFGKEDQQMNRNARTLVNTQTVCIKGNMDVAWIEDAIAKFHGCCMLARTGKGKDEQAELAGK